MYQQSGRGQSKKPTKHARKIIPPSRQPGSNLPQPHRTAYLLPQPATGRTTMTTTTGPNTTPHPPAPPAPQPHLALNKPPKPATAAKCPTQHTSPNTRKCNRTWTTMTPPQTATPSVNPLSMAIPSPPPQAMLHRNQYRNLPPTPHSLQKSPSRRLNLPPIAPTPHLPMFPRRWWIS